MNIRTLMIGVCLANVLVVSGCAKSMKTVDNADTISVAAKMSPLEHVIAGEWRGDEAQRDVFRHPKETLEFFGLAPEQTIVEIYPGGGWYSNILTPYSKATGGTYIAAGVGKRFKDKFETNGELYGLVTSVDFSDKSPLLAGGQADLVLSFRNVHSWVSRGFEEKAFADFYAALKPGGILGIVEHRLPESGEQDLKTRDGYVQASFVKSLAAEVGFEFVGSSEINANPKDTADHPFGVWTLPPVSSSAKRGEEMAADFDEAKYKAIGESDRFTLKFRKPM
ncbi:MAG: class I SAM-dependent methyltransferase [Robiginitomaculum sp.]|nr:class I SAM-dependent methyltransferase [Robiginitomaculum sp.]